MRLSNGFVCDLAMHHVQAADEPFVLDIIVMNANQVGPVKIKSKVGAAQAGRG